MPAAFSMADEWRRVQTVQVLGSASMDFNLWAYHFQSARAARSRQWRKVPASPRSSVLWQKVLVARLRDLGLEGPWPMDAGMRIRRSASGLEGLPHTRKHRKNLPDPVALSKTWTQDNS